MMKLSTMKKMVATLNENWQSPLGEKIMELWEHDPGSLYYVRSSANSVFSFTRQGVRRYLRFNDECERIRASIEAEMDVLLYLREQSIRAGQPVKSRNGRYVEEVPTQWGTFHATVFEAVEGNQIDDEQLTEEQFVAWGRGLGRLHHIFKQMPKETSERRPDWRNHLESVRDTVPAEEEAIHRELGLVLHWAESLEQTEDTYGLIHYDFDMDNQHWVGDDVGVFDFDECARYWYAADIAFTLKDLWLEGTEGAHPGIQQFVRGYALETSVDPLLPEQIPWFIRMYELILYADLYRSVDIDPTSDHPEWLMGLNCIADASVR
ncbi:phosphotransferase [Paenibacillus profundus]|uniref:Phosphotransferase n=1 Tax=Paenibacillus profundus TaxID=1173085 RepID=A0ABS8YGR4_9BACL|nr:phosphotransferase [Paenibacillus profundus]MCE5169750.1 phosphotransferase [Paenibacillus profundus]